MVIKYLTYIKDNAEPVIPQPLPDTEMSKCITDQWYVEFINVSDEKCYELMLAASYMNVESLLQLASAKIASMIFDMTIEQKR
jgi:S-phase kinase-associated protein 1